MQNKERMIIREAWGDKPCDHPHIEREYDLGADTGDLVCTQCGRIVDEKVQNEKHKN